MTCVWFLRQIQKPTLSLPESKRSADRSGSRQSNSASTWLWFSGTTGIRDIFPSDPPQLREKQGVSKAWKMCAPSAVTTLTYHSCLLCGITWLLVNWPVMTPLTLATAWWTSPSHQTSSVITSMRCQCRSGSLSHIFKYTGLRLNI